jgi:hypothetical protein
MISDVIQNSLLIYIAIIVTKIYLSDETNP